MLIAQGVISGKKEHDKMAKPVAKVEEAAPAATPAAAESPAAEAPAAE
jgi:hypothetical protein